MATCETCGSQLSSGTACQRCAAPQLLALFDDDEVDFIDEEEDDIRIQGYSIVEPIGEGGAGSVFRARQDSLNRDVALKVLNHVGSRKGRSRFELEVEILTQLDEEGIPDIIDSGVSDNVYYYAMDLIDGKPLCHDFCEKRTLSERDRIILFEKVCRIVQQAHRKGIIHRDLKPSNILVTVDLDPKVLDFGVAKMIDREDQAQVTHIVPGTPHFMSPEQARSEGVDMSSDVYSLGTLLYELMTDCLPFEGSPDVVKHKIAQESPPRPCSKKPDLHREIEAIIIKAMARDPENRYQTAGNLADDLQNFLEDRPVTARTLTPLYALKKSVRRHWPYYAIGIAALVMAVSGLTIYVNDINRYSHELEASNEKLRESNARSESIVSDLTFTLMQEELASGNYKRALKVNSILEKHFKNLSSEDISPEGHVTLSIALALRGRYFSDTGDYNKAEMLLIKANEILYSIEGEKSLGLRYQNIATNHSAFGTLFNRQRMLNKAKNNYETALKYWEKVAQYPDLLQESVKGKASALRGLGYGSKEKKEFTKALSFFEQSKELVESLGDSELTSNASWCELLEDSAEAEWRIGKYEEASSTLAEIIKVRKKLVLERPDVPSHYSALVRSHSRLAEVMIKRERLDLDVPEEEKAHKIKQLDLAALEAKKGLQVSRDARTFGIEPGPLNSAERMLAVVFRMLADGYLILREEEKMLSCNQDYLTICQEVVDMVPSDRNERFLIKAHIDYAKHAERFGEYGLAAEQAKQAVARCESYVKNHGSHDEVAKFLEQSKELARMNAFFDLFKMKAPKEP